MTAKNTEVFGYANQDCSYNSIKLKKVYFNFVVRVPEKKFGNQSHQTFLRFPFVIVKLESFFTYLKNVFTVKWPNLIVKNAKICVLYDWIFRIGTRFPNFPTSPKLISESFDLKI